MVPDPKDPQCCKMPECDSATGTGGSLTGGNSPLGFTGTFQGTGRPAGANIQNTGYRSSCIYKGQIYAQGATWHDGCDLDCECTNAQQGIYSCTDRCQRYAALPSGCNLVQDPNDQCCVVAQCAPPAQGNCQDKLNNCYMYGKYSCNPPYEQWAHDNCAAFCGFCGVSGNFGVVTGATNNVVTGQTLGCYYNGRLYAHNEEWQDGCDYNCTCVNGQTGFYRCGARCMTYDYLPNECHLEKPPGECCAKPVCNGQTLNVSSGSYRQPVR
nr:hypothetical protein BaRGS_003854 [Batillaria attramentaria]